MKNGKLKAETVVKGKDLKGDTFYKILPEDMAADGFQYRVGMNTCAGAGNGIFWQRLIFYPAQYIGYSLDEGTKLAVVSVPEDEDVYVGYRTYHTNRLVVEKILDSGRVLGSPEGWECLMLNGMDITEDYDHAVRWAAANGHLEAVKYLHQSGADIMAYDNYAVRHAAANGHLDAVKYLYENGADISAWNNYAIWAAKQNGFLKAAEYLKKNM